MAKDRKRIFAANLKAERNRKFLSQEELAEKANVSSQTISKLERGVQTPTLYTALDIAVALNIEITDLTKGM